MICKFSSADYFVGKRRKIGKFSLIMSNDSLSTTTRLRITEPVYTSDKRAKFTQRENKKLVVN